MTSAQKSDAGFTLLELLAVLLIASITLIVAAPVFTGSANKRAIENITSAILTKIDQTRNRAMTTGTPLGFTIDPSTQSFRTDDGHLTSLPQGMTISLPSDIQLIVFRPDGTATPAEFALRKGNASARVGVDWLTGRATVAFER